MQGDLIGQREIRWIERRFGQPIDVILPIEYVRKESKRFSSLVPVQRFKLRREKRYRTYGRTGLVQ